MSSLVSESEALSYISSIPIGNAAGVSRNPKLLLNYGEVGTTYVTFGSTTREPRAGNPGDNFYYDEQSGAAINALGIPDAGILAHLPTLKALRRQCEEVGTKLVVSISAGNAFDADEYAWMAQKLVAEGAAHIIEGNFACPNIEVNGKRKPVVCYNASDFEAGVMALRRGAGDQPIAAKISPITEDSSLGTLVDICLKWGVDVIVAANTVPHSFLEKQDGSPAIAMGRGGLSGAPLRPMVSGMIKTIMPQLVGRNTKLIAVGGIASGEDAYRYLRLGAHGISIATELYRHGGDPKVLARIAYELVECILAHGLPVRS